MTWFKYNVYRDGKAKTTDDMTNPLPFLVEMGLDLLDILAPVSVKEYFEENEGDQPWLPVIIWNVQNYLIATLGKELQKASNMHALTSRNLGGFNSLIFDIIATTLQSFGYKTSTVVQGGDTFGMGTMFETSNAAKRLRATQQARESAAILKAAQDMAKSMGLNSLNRLALKTPEGSDKAGTKDREGRQGKRSLDEYTTWEGDILLPNGSEPLTPPPITDPTQKPCLSFYRYGRVCPRERKGKECKLCHIKIDGLKPDSQAKWLAHIKSVPGAKLIKNTVTCFPAETDLLAEPSLTYYSIPKKRAKTQ